jgi:EAL domain-containing protein (putative c-di-GMP-specific phosphodiesterase class I)/GGDEF domain-containing protein
MANNELQNEMDGNRPDQSQQPDGSRSPKVILLFPQDAMLPLDWRTPWLQAGWTVTTCDGPEEITEIAARPVMKGLIASPWPNSGDASSVEEMARGFQGVIAALNVSDEDARPEAAVVGGMVRRGDFLSHLSVVMAAPGNGFWVLMAIRVDRLSELTSRLDRTAIFDLEERISARFAALLREDDAYTIWLELGFGVLVQRENSEQVLALAERICAAIANEPFVVAGEPAHLTVSVGVALPPIGNATNGAGRWFATAHAAQAIAFRHGGNKPEGVLSREFEPMPAERVLIIREWVQDAKSGENVMIEFQPVVPLNARAEDLYSVHAKLRDYRAPLGGVYRREYLRLAREAGAMIMIDRMSLFGAFEALEQERSRGRPTRLLVPLEMDTLEGVPWRWLEAELHRRHHLVDGLILELEASPELQEPESLERIGKLREFGVRIGLSDRSMGLERMAIWSNLPADILRLQSQLVDSVSPEIFRERLSPWLEQGRQLIVDSVERAGDMAHYTGLGVDYLRGQALAAIGPRLDFEFSDTT